MICDGFRRFLRLIVRHNLDSRDDGVASTAGNVVPADARWTQHRAEVYGPGLNGISQARFKHGRYTKQAKADAGEVRRIMRELTAPSPTRATVGPKTQDALVCKTYLERQTVTSHRRVMGYFEVC
jgi:hypothetical protein